jgi:hypothetical protein
MPCECHVLASQYHFLAQSGVSRLTQGKESTRKQSVSTNKSLFVLAFLTAAVPAYANTANDDWDGGFEGPKAQRRSDVVIGLRIAPTLGWARGYPNEASKIDQPQYLANTGAGVGVGYALYFGGALRDWFTFALGIESIGFTGNSISAGAGIYTLRTEIYPAWTLGCPWRDLGVAVDFGIGGMKMKRDNVDVADGGAIGAAGIEVFHETLRLGGFAFGPALGYRQLFSQSLDGNVLYLGLHSAFYTGP